MKIQLNQLKDEVIYQDSQARLFEMMVEIKEEVAEAYLQVVKTEDEIQKVTLKGRVSVLNTLFTIIEKRIDDVRVNDQDKDRKEMFTNRQFRLAAEAVLQRDTFEKIKELSLLNYKKFKDSRAGLRENKLE
jgi:hypothetical protein